MSGDPYGSTGNLNPYAPPAHDGLGLASAPGVIAPNAGYERVGDLLIIQKGATLPVEICIATGERSDGQPVNKKLQWANPLIGLAILINLLVYLVLYFVFRKTGDLTYGLSAAFRKRRLYAIVAAIAGPVVFMFFAGLAFSADLFGLGMICILGVLAPIITGAIMAQPFRIQKIDDDHIHLKVKPAVFDALGL